ncbi:uncharacterized protein LOC119489278 [Sebastes umbrosus]|uniref:uncharacterized protein LOC119489278 n=1 Tax=Sebastes umbrosus TaxID=72105 RepID=UPI00189D3C4B|nr:uncharacterized protein LOC119489278 [Sebastes umbrosus]XP_037627442.1 uncharacterized protein LOC119489278 [Sebastes umbrosus]
MSQKVLFIKLLLLHYATQSRPENNANCYEDVQVMCPDEAIDSRDFISVAWYKINNSQKLGIIRKSKDSKTPQYYPFTRSHKPEFGEKYSLLLPRVTPEDSGTYECEISANVGGQNMNLEVDLTVHACVTQADLTTITTTPEFNLTQPNLPCHNQVEDLPVMWSGIGFVAVGLTKIILSLISIQVVQAVCMRSSR